MDQKKKKKKQWNKPHQSYLAFLNVLQSNVSWHKDKIWYLAETKIPWIGSM